MPRSRRRDGSRRRAAALALLSAASACAFSPDFGGAACSRSSPCFHVVPHSHMDPGWRATFAEYYPRAASVFEGVVEALCAQPSRTFALGDAAFLVTWLRRVGGGAAPARCGGATWRQALASLAADGRLELVGGGWVSPDELLAPPDGVLHAFASGLDALAAELPGAPRPAVAWQIDPFGHGAPTPEVLLALNFSAVVLNRVPAKERDGMRADRALDFRWAAAPGAAALRAHVLHGHYGSPPGVDAAVVKAARPLVVAEAADRAASRALLADLRARARASRSGHALLLVGDDFRYDGNAAAALGSLDALLAAFGDSERRTGAPRLRYSTPSAYFAAAAGGPPLPLREGAFAPYSDATPAGENTWSGAYAARPGVKAAAWAASAAARAGVAAAALAGGGAGAADAAKAEERAALLGHHDAVTGTCAAPVAADYRAAGAAARASARAAATAAVMRMLRCDTAPAVAPVSASLLGFTLGGADSGATTPVGSSLEDQGVVFTLAVFNPLGWTVEAEASMPLPPPPSGPGAEDLTLTLRDARTGRALKCQIDPPETAEEEEDAATEAHAAPDARAPPPARRSRDGSVSPGDDEAPRRLMLRLIVPDVPALGTVAVNARWVPRGQIKPRPLWPCEPPQHRHVRSDAPGAAVGVRSAPGASALLMPLRGHGFGRGAGVSLAAQFPPPDGVDEPHTHVRLTLRALRYVFLPDDDAFGAGPYVTRSLLAGGVYLWAGLACGGAAAALAAAALSAAAAARGRRRGGGAALAPRPRVLPGTPPSPSNAPGRGIGAASPRNRRGALAAAKALLTAMAAAFTRGLASMHPTRRAAGGGAAFAAAAVAVLLQSRALSDDAARAVLTHGFAVGAPLGGAATALVALHRGGGAVASAAFVAGGAVGVPLWLLVAPGWHARLPPRAPADEAARAAGCAHGAVSSTCTVSLGALASATLRASARPLAPLILTLSARAEDDSEVVARFAAMSRAPRVGGGALRDDGAAARAFRFVAGRSVPGNAAPLAGFAALPGFALLPLRPTGGAALGGGAELSVARSVTSDDGRGLGRGAPGRDATQATLRLVLRPPATPAVLRAEQRAALHVPVAVRLPAACAADTAAGSVWPRLTAPLPPDVHVAMLRGPAPDEAADAPLRLTLQHLGEPGADGPHALASLAAALGGTAEALHSEGVYAALRPGGLAQLRWRPAWEEAPRVAPQPPRGAQNCLRLPPGEPCVDNDGLF